MMNVSCNLFCTLLILIAVTCSASTPLSKNFKDGLLENNNGNFLEAFNTWLVGAESGDPMSQFAIATLYRKGVGVDKDLERSSKWMLKSAKAGYVEAMRNLGSSYLSGVSGFDKDIVKSVEWYEQAAIFGTYYDQHAIAALYGTTEFESYDSDDIKKFYWAKKSVEYYRSKYILGEIYYRGNAVEKDLVKSWVFIKLFHEEHLKDPKFSELDRKTQNFYISNPDYLEIEEELTKEEKEKGELLLPKARKDIDILFGGGGR